MPRGIVETRAGALAAATGIVEPGPGALAAATGIVEPGPGALAAATGIMEIGAKVVEVRTRKLGKADAPCAVSRKAYRVEVVEMPGTLLAAKHIKKANAPVRRGSKTFEGRLIREGREKGVSKSEIQQWMREI